LGVSFLDWPAGRKGGGALFLLSKRPIRDIWFTVRQFEGDWLQWGISKTNVIFS
jgi:hypothetical protein